MRNLLKIEEAAMFVTGLLLLWSFNIPLLWLVLLFFAPDLGAIGYLAGPRVGPLTYNAFHYKGIAIALYLFGVYTSQSTLQGLIMFAHSSFDRMFGFGVNYPDSFQNSHLGPIGLARNS